MLMTTEKKKKFMTFQEDQNVILYKMQQSNNTGEFDLGINT